MNCHVCHKAPAACFCPCPLCGKRSDTLPDSPESCQCAYEDLTVALRLRDAYAEQFKRAAQRAAGDLNFIRLNCWQMSREAIASAADEAMQAIDAALSKNTTTDAPESRQGTDPSEPKNSYPADSGATLSDSSGASGASTNSAPLGVVNEWTDLKGWLFWLDGMAQTGRHDFYGQIAAELRRLHSPPSQGNPT